MKKEREEEEFIESLAQNYEAIWLNDSDPEDESEMLLERAIDWYVFSSEPENALPLVERVLSIDPINRDALLLKARILLSLDRYQEAEITIHELLDAYPDCADAYEALGSLYYHRQQFEKAMESYLQGLAWLPKSSDADDENPDIITTSLLFDGIASCLQALGRYDEAIEYLREGCRRYPNSKLMADDLQRVSKHTGKRSGD